jgi:hyperosmotically inducible periplasmic protein
MAIVKIRLLLLALLGTLVLGLHSATGQTPHRTDVQVFHDVSRQINQYVNFTVFDSVDASVTSGVVTLRGKVTMPYKVEDLMRRVGRVPGVRTIDNQVQVLPASPFDDELRLRIARAIYGNPNFWQYASMANPPIHIIVERGHVTLHGVVDSHVERLLARSLAIGFGELSLESHLRTDAEVQYELASLD